MGLFEWLLLLAAILYVFYIWIKYHYSYWRRKRVPYIEPMPIFGNLKEMFLMKSCAADHMVALYNHKTAQGQPVVGIHVFNKPALLLRDPELIKSILIKDFNKFSNRFSACDSKRDALGTYNLFFVKNPLWRELRTKLTSVFSSAKTKQMFTLVEETGIELDRYLCSLPLDPGTSSCIKEVRQISAFYSTDVIATVAFGVQVNSLKNPDCDFQGFAKGIFNFTPHRALEFSIIFFIPQLVELFRCKLFSQPSTDFIRQAVKFVMDERMKSDTLRNDLIDVLVAFRKAAEADKDKLHFALDTDVLAAQASAFFTAGFDTAASAMSFGLYELSKRPNLQKRVRGEIREALLRSGGKFTYEMINEMEYLDMFIQETLRLYPPLPFLDRVCTLAKDDKEYSLEPFSDFCVPNGMPVYIPVFAIQRDPKYFPNPDEFDPERFSPESKHNIVPCTYMPFGAGPHRCLGVTFGIMQTKIGLINFLRNHYVTPCGKSAKYMVLEPKAMIIQAKGGIYCNLVRDPLLI